MSAVWHRTVNAAAVCAVLAVVIFVCRQSIFLNGVDTAHHFVLVDELVQHHGVAPGDAGRLGTMAVYPPLAHWMAALVAPVSGSGLVAMVWVAAVSIFLCYVMLFWLAQRDRGVTSAAIFAVALICLGPLNSLIGWEVVANFFYPQLVADVFAIGFLCAIVGSEDWERALPALAPLAGAILIYVQPLVAVHVMGFGLSFMLLRAVHAWRAVRKLDRNLVLSVLVSGAVCLTVVAVHPIIRLMRVIAENDGSITANVTHVSYVIGPATIIAASLLWLFVIDRGTRTDGVIGSALASATALIAIQDLLWIGLHQGSPYAVKKHLYLVVTLAAVGGARLIGRSLKSMPRIVSGPVEIAAAGAMTVWLVVPQLVPSEVILEPLRYAQLVAARPDVPEASIASADDKVPSLVNVIVSLVGFHHFNGGLTYTSYFNGGPTGGAQFAKRLMVRHTPEIDRTCSDQFMAGSAYTIIKVECLRHYDFGTTISFAKGGNAEVYTPATEWSESEPIARWAIGERGSSAIFLINKSPNDIILSVEALALTRGNASRAIHVKCNDVQISVWQLTGDIRPYSAKIPATLAERGRLEIRFVPDEVIKPGGDDQRPLGIGLKSLVLTAE